MSEYLFGLFYISCKGKTNQYERKWGYVISIKFLFHTFSRAPHTADSVRT